MDPIAKLEVVLNVLNTALTKALYYDAPQIKILQDMQYDIYHGPLLSCEEMDNLLQKITSLKSEIITSTKKYDQ